MKPQPVPALGLTFVLGGVLLMSACKQETRQSSGENPPPPPPAAVPLDPNAVPEVPLLPLTQGDFWRYQVQVEVPPQADPAGTPGTSTYQSTRTYLGKLKPIPDKPEVDVFEVVIPNSPTERELVEVYEDRILMRGSIMITDGVAAKPMWLEPPVPLVLSYIRTGSSLPRLTVAKGGISRSISVVGREDVTVPAGTFRSIHLLMIGKDGDLEMRRTIWFAPRVGIVKELTTRYAKDTMLLRQTQELIETNLKQP